MGEMATENTRKGILCLSCPYCHRAQLAIATSSLLLPVALMLQDYFRHGNGRQLHCDQGHSLFIRVRRTWSNDRFSYLISLLNWTDFSLFFKVAWCAASGSDGLCTMRKRTEVTIMQFQLSICSLSHKGWTAQIARVTPFTGKVVRIWEWHTP